MTTKNSCYTYFKIVGDFDPDAITSLLQLKPDKYHKGTDKRPDGKAYGFASWNFGRCEAYNPIVSYQMQRTLAPLFDKTHVLNEIRERNDVCFYLSVVPQVFAGDIAPALAPSLEVIDFCHATRTEIDIDMYVYESSAED